MFLLETRNIPVVPLQFLVNGPTKPSRGPSATAQARQKSCTDSESKKNGGPFEA